MIQQPLTGITRPTAATRPTPDYFLLGIFRHTNDSLFSQINQKNQAVRCEKAETG
jgi:hypothetical protein